jgi:hypothetical protein
MNREEIKSIVTNNFAKPYRVNLIGGGSKIVRLWQTNDGRIAIMDKGRKKWGHELNTWSDHYEDWATLRLVEHDEIDYYKRFVKRATDALKMLNESGLWKDIKQSIEHFFALTESEQKELVNDIMTDSYELFYKEVYKENGKYSWVSGYQVFEAFVRKTCWKSIAWRKWERECMSAEVADCIKNGIEFSKRWENGYDNSLEISFDNDYPRGWYSCEYRGTGNGHYYLLFDATHAIFYEDD